MKLVLIGYMASGKSAVGKLLARQLQLEFIDLDDFIEKQEKRTIKEIFEFEGEIYFRRKEGEYLKQLLVSNTSFVLSSGGGTPCYGQNIGFITEFSTSVYLEASISTIYTRLKSETSERPLVADLSDEKLQEFIAKHLFERRPFYEKSRYKVDVNNHDVPTIVNSILSLV